MKVLRHAAVLGCVTGALFVALAEVATAQGGVTPVTPPAARIHSKSTDQTGVTPAATPRGHEVGGTAPAPVVPPRRPLV